MNLPPFHSFPVLTSGTVLLRQVEPADASSLLEISFYDARPARNPGEAAQMQQKINADYRAGTGIHWVIVSSATAEVVGTVGYYRGFAHSVGELGCVLKPAFRGQGLMSQAMKLAIGFGLGTMLLSQVKAITGRQNAAAIRLLGRLGFRQTANLANDEVAYSLT
ncbi:GNAT family N-acetyltransferase [Hymenobacter armeniacus]|uniref:GNAT family N-acetyltransferase n=1 Tax=Hymenobacter armeniacus TaxID=2771358 RepID=A0ABR8JRI7_9BACT|nr:GNAT family N-acetyltransferase [Hymenobacter armeniacus]MBD2721932.1 GNAT family N-acetyltransferase [Hymenobacter armeniacus]